MKLNNLPYVTKLKYNHLKNWIRPNGQISLHSELGRLLFAISSLSENKVVVEIGTWNGLGSGTIIAKGITASKSHSKALGLEVDYNRVSQARRHLRKYNFFSVVHGRIIEVVDLDSSSLNDIEKQWFDSDVQNMSAAPNILDSLPKQIDVLLLDGGEFSSYAEYVALKDRVVKWLILDDVNVRKNCRVLKEAIESGDFTQVWKSNERNGTAILVKRA
jgi:tRNA A58 N-methylase Trm61